MAIRKFEDLENETDARFEKLKKSKQRANVAQVFEETTVNEHGVIDEAIQFLNKKLDECIDTINTNNEASGSLETKLKSITSFPGFGTSSTTALRGNTTTISTSQANAITANTAKADGRYIHFPVIANFYGNINTEQFVSLADGSDITSSVLNRRVNFIAPCTGTIYKVFVRSNASLQSGGKGVTLTGKLTKYPNGSDAKPSTGTTTVTTGITSTVNTLDFSSVSNNSFAAGDRLLVSLQAPLDADKNYYVTVLFKLDQNGI